MEGNASVHQVNPVSRTSGEGRAEFLRTWGAGFVQKGARGGEGGEGTGGAGQFVRGNYKSFLWGMGDEGGGGDNYMKEIHIAKYNRRGDVVMQNHHHEVRIASVMKGTLGVPALNYVTSLVMLRLA